MARRLRMVAAATKHRPSPVVTRKAWSSNWTIAQAVHVFRQGYPIEHAARLSGIPARVIIANIGTDHDRPHARRVAATTAASQQAH